MMATSFTLSNLRDAPHFCETMAQRIWQAWWQENGVSLEAVEARVRESLQPAGIPFSLVAHRGDVFIGTVSVIENDLDERPQYTPWIAALWVDECYRREGAGAALMQAATSACFRAGMPEIYLCATPENSLFYERMGWQIIETGVDDLNIFRIRKPLDLSNQCN